MIETLTHTHPDVRHTVQHFPADENHGEFTVSTIARSSADMSLFTGVSDHGSVNLFGVVSIVPTKGLYGPCWLFRLADGQTVFVRTYMQDA
jgi:hypothetical protein